MDEQINEGGMAIQWNISQRERMEILLLCYHTRMKLGDIMLCEMSVTERQILYSFTPGSYLEYQIHRVEWWLLGDGVGVEGIFV